jgi:hypothetical protein
LKKSVSKETFTRAIRIFENGYPQIDGKSLEENFPTSVREELIRFKALTKGPLVTAVEDDTDFNAGCVKPDWDPVRKCYVYFSPAAGAWISVPNEHMKSYILDKMWFCRIIQNRLEIPFKYKPRCLLESYLWDLGPAWIGQNKVSILLCREIFHAEAFDRVCSALLNRTDILQPAMALSTSLNISRHAFLPGGIRIQSLENCIEETRWGFGLSREPLEKALFNTAGAGKAYSPIEYNFDYSSVRIRGQEFIFRGVRHREIIRVLIRDFKLGIKRSHVQSVLEEAESKATSIPRAFKGSKNNWEELIGFGDGGFCWLKV